ncbi:DinB superfamily protein [Cyclonatronum proteinivorum]|uniref:DinB superfamily protein n=1 Tax=Cyclonatronum proteinivorum TaxID=1457365 RepID=A0A345UNE4_9BACT|nr:DinB family protein [Cyclonatronum proteinivorum]AXJ01996.1 DinB superfamily protein [Cyclonatronum proteinivorum]
MKLRSYAEWEASCKSCLKDAREITRQMDHDAFNWKPSPNKWSAAECLEHLNMSASKMLPILDTALRKGASNQITGEPPFETGFIGAWFLRGSGPSGKPVPAPAVYKPAQSSYTKEKILGRFEALQQDYQRLLGFSQRHELDLSRIYARSAFTPLLRFNAATWFQAMPGHQQRHLSQIRRLTASPDFPAA